MAEIYATKDLYGEYVGNGCCCTPACCNVTVSPHMCCADSDCFVCVQPGICGCGPPCPIFCSPTYYRASCCGPNVFCLCPYGDAQKFTAKGETAAFEPCCCGCGSGYVKKPAGGTPGSDEMER